MAAGFRRKTLLRSLGFEIFAGAEPVLRCASLPLPFDRLTPSGLPSSRAVAAFSRVAVIRLAHRAGQQLIFSQGSAVCCGARNGCLPSVPLFRARPLSQVAFALRFAVGLCVGLPAVRRNRPGQQFGLDGCSMPALPV